MPSDLAPALLARVAERFRALGDESRLRLLMRLRRGPADVSTLVEATGIAQASVSKHLAVLRAAGLVAGERAGARVTYRVRDAGLGTLCDTVCAGVAAFAAEEHAALATPRSRR